ncbi:hypothetical protein ERO13_A01G160200v2 [Gossypium hirsutum]|uniref:Protein SAR DEFICIENT 1 isoform X1 n=3 Tax=Gossypium TaxID=3633 RepID=A0A1U8KG13_GOSHI|nr:protein SAR DEFICIENT 1 isoform X1 [Gossypium hirsutum]XP_040967315.1 protein SAR DEFICIENT 1 isoform X1 [Gossypium hirsutum]KAG4215152.1 hypothetical protein ERO13_A01G160200v2 [Gossypium hirsutum]TYH31585.1 hypothetical protein ES288_A01G184200v1 [Gossypium darwinii]TYH31586.1 hypothetical protein ES288_A01G184200v1 [Gossypium darwinii]
MTEAFVVKDHYGELYKKHHPPMLGDEVWWLEKIGKDGAFHKKLAYEGVNTVQDFLKMLVVDPPKLRNILGPGMSEKMWDVTIKHAKTCVMGNKYYIFQGTNYRIFLNPICQLVKAEINGTTYPIQTLSSINRVHTLAFCSGVLDYLAVELKASKDFSKLYAGIGILWFHLSLNQPFVIYCFFFFSDLFPLINER